MCDERERLIGYVYDECDASERQEIDRHLESCETCQQEIGGLRSVRQDLLAWDVPEHGSVWRPFAPPRPAPWYREVPAWAMAAAAGLMFMCGLGGGVMTHALTREPAAPIQVAATQPVRPNYGSMVTEDQLSAAEKRILGELRAALAQQAVRVERAGQARVTAASYAPSDAATAHSESDLEVLKLIVSDLTKARQEINSLRQNNAELRKSVNLLLGSPEIK